MVASEMPIRRAHTRRNPHGGPPIPVAAHPLRTTNQTSATAAAMRLVRVDPHEASMPFPAVTGTPESVAKALIADLEASRSELTALASDWDSTTPLMLPASQATALAQQKTFPSGDEAELTELMRSYGVSDRTPGATEVWVAAASRSAGSADLSALVSKYGTLPVIAAKPSDPTVAARRAEWVSHGAIVVFDPADPDHRPPLSNPDAPWGGRAHVDDSMRGVLTHEYGHYLHERIGGTRIAEFHDAWNAAHAFHAKPLSDRATHSVGEAFAEAVAAVTHPNYDPERFHTAADRMLGVVERVVDDAWNG